MKAKVEYIQDQFGNNYIGVNIYKDIISPFLNTIKNAIGDEYDEYVKYQQDRDHGHYHITVINVMEYNKLCKDKGIDKFVNSLDDVFNYECDDIKLIGVGTATRGENRTYFVVVNSESLQEIRKKYGLPEQDFHITIAFKYKDVFGVPKNIVMKEFNPFLKLLRSEYYNNHENFDFIRYIDNFDMDPDDEIYLVDLKDTYATFKTGETNNFIVGLIDDKFWISAKWQEDNKDIPVMPTTIISKKLKDI